MYKGKNVVNMNREKKIVRTSILSILTNIFLVIFKAIIGVLANSTAVIMDAVNNLSDAMSSAVTIVGTKLSNKRPTKKHPYGFGQIEHITSVIVSAIVLVAGITACVESVNKIIVPEETDYKWFSIVIICVGIVIKLALGLFTKHQGKKYNSQALIASGSEAFFDSIVSVSTLVAAIISINNGPNIEGYLGVIISGLIIKSGIEILLESLGEIIGTRIPKELAISVKREINSNDLVHGAYDLTLNKYGPEKIIGSVHVEVDDDLPAYEIHRLTQKITNDIYAKFGIVITVGIYATNSNSPFYREVKTFVRENIKENKNVLQMHGFYFDEELKRISFDLVFSFDEKEPVKVVNELISKCEEKYKDYKFSINIDHDISD